MNAETSRKVANMGFVCALLVVLIHCGHYPKEVGSVGWMFYYGLRYILAPIAVPYFFIVSGYFLSVRSDSSGWWRLALVKRLKTLVIPFTIWNVLTILVYRYGLVPLDDYLSSGHWMCHSLSFVTLINGLGIHPSHPPADTPLWFVRALLFFVLIAPGLVWMIKRFNVWFLAVLFVVYLALNPGHVGDAKFWIGKEVRSFLRFGLSVEGLFYFSLGIFFARRGAVRLRSTWQGGVVGCAIGLALGFLGMTIKMAGASDYGYCIACSIPFMLCGIWHVVSTRQWSSVFVGNAFAIYVIHSLFMTVFNIICKVLEVEIIDGILTLMVEWLFVVGASIFTVIILKNASPKVSAIMFGGR